MLLFCHNNFGPLRVDFPCFFGIRLARIPTGGLFGPCPATIGSVGNCANAKLETCFFAKGRAAGASPDFKDTRRRRPLWRAARAGPAHEAAGRYGRVASAGRRRDRTARRLGVRPAEVHHGPPAETRRCRWGKHSDERIFGQARRRHRRSPRFPGGRHRGVRRHYDARLRPDGRSRAAAPGGRQGLSHRGRARGRARRPPRLVGRAARPGHRAHRAARQIHQCRGGARFRPGAPSGDRCRPGAGARGAQAAARPAYDREGGVQCRRPADDLGHPRLQGLAANGGCRRRRTAEGGRRRDHRQDQRAGGTSRLAEHDIRSMAPPAIPTISSGRRAVRRAARPQHWRPAT